MEPKIPQLETWIAKRRTTIKALVALADVLDQQLRTSNIAGVAGSSTAVVGSVASIGVALSPVTGGAAMVPALVLGVGGSVASLGAKLLKHRKVKEILSETQKLIDEDRKITRELESIVQNLSEAEMSIIKYFEGLVENELPQQPMQPLVLKNGNTDQVKKERVHVKEVATAAAMKAPMVLQKGIGILRSKNLLNIRNLSKMLNTGKSGGSAVLKATKQVGPKVMNVGRAMKIGGLAVSAALLPFDIIDLVQSSLNLHRGQSHEVSIEVKSIAERLEHEVVEVQVYLRATVKDMNNLILLIKQIKQNSCPATMHTMLNQILKKLLVGKKVLKAFDSCDLGGIPEATLGVQMNDKLAGILVNCDGFKKSFLRELATVIWMAWKLEDNGFAFLQNTSSFEFAPRLWTLFGVSVNSSGQTSNGGVSVLFPLNFQGDVIFNDEFRDESDVNSDWNGRCIVVTVTIKGREYTLVNMLAPDAVLDMKLFIQNATMFVEKHARGNIVLGANFRSELPTMTTQVKKRVCTRTPLAFVEALIPYRDVSGYLINRPKHMDAPNILMYNMCKDLTLIDCGTLDINWRHWEMVAMSTDDCSSRIKPLEKLGLAEVWLRKNSGVVEFSSVKRVCHRVVTCGQNLEFFVTAELADDIHECSIDHCLRFLGFLHQSVITFSTD